MHHAISVAETLAEQICRSLPRHNTAVVAIEVFLTLGPVEARRLIEVASQNHRYVCSELACRRVDKRLCRRHTVALCINLQNLVHIGYRFRHHVPAQHATVAIAARIVARIPAILRVRRIHGYLCGVVILQHHAKHPLVHRHCLCNWIFRQHTPAAHLSLIVIETTRLELLLQIVNYLV